MCGIALIVGPDPDPKVHDSMLAAIAPRGEAREILRDERHLLGTHRSAILLILPEEESVISESFRPG